MHDFTGLEAAIAEIGHRPVYLTIDLDVLDPSVLPGTGTRRRAESLSPI